MASTSAEVQATMTTPDRKLADLRPALLPGKSFEYIFSLTPNNMAFPLKITCKA